ncbi:MAG TPA: O-antigen polymerase, partial [Flavobacterium sp.]
MDELYKSLVNIEDVEIFGGIIRGNRYLLIIDLILIIHFIIYWAYVVRKSNWKIDFWHTTVFVKFFFPVLIMYPFNNSKLNRYAVGKDYFDAFEEFVDLAFFITVIGYLSLYIGRFLYNTKSSHSILNNTFKPLEKIIQGNIKSLGTLALLLLTYSSFLAIVIYLQIQTNTLFNPRDYFQANDTIRPIYNTCLSVFPVALIFVGIRMYIRKSKANITLFSLLLMSSIFLGTRSVMLEPLITLIFLYFFYNNHKVNFRRLVQVGIVIIFVTLLLLNLRAGRSLDKTVSNLNKDIFYGNTFSDTRDFALILSFWDFKPVNGQTYLAGMISFMPRAISEYRQQWALSVYTNKFVGADTRYHPGFRPGSFGESFFNFGILGVSFLGIILGYGLRHVDYSMKHIMINEKDIIKCYSKTILWTFLLCFCISIGFYSFYIFIILNVTLAFIRQLLFQIFKP